jgi:hypothetical protein
VEFAKKIGRAFGRIVKFLVRVRMGGDRIESDDR